MPTLQETSLMVSDWDTWEKTLDPAKRQQLDSVFRFETDKVAAQQRFAAVAHVSAATGADIEDVSRRFETSYMPRFAADSAKGFGKADGVKDFNEFYGLLRGRTDTLKMRNELFTDAAGAALESVLNDGNSLADFAAWQAGQDHEDAYGGKALEVWKKAREEARAKLGPDGLAIAKRGVRAMRTETGVAQEGDAWMNEARRDLIRVKAENPAKYNLILGAMTRLGKAAPKGDKGVVEGMGEQAGRVLGDMATGAADFGANIMRDASASLAEAGITNAENPEALAAQIRAGRDVDIDLEDLKRGVIDPIKSERDGWAGWIEDAAYGLSSSAPIMAAARNPFGQLALAGMFADEGYNDFRQAGWTGASAAGAAVVSGVFQTGVEYVSELATKIPGVAGVMSKFGVKPGSSWAAQFFMRSGIRAGIELGEEAVQQAANPFIQELGAVITQAIPDRPEGQKLKDVMGEFMKADNFMPLMLSVLPLGMMGAQMSTSQDMAVINAVTSNDKLLRAVFSEEDTAAIIAEGDPAKRQELIQEKWVATPIPDIVERARALMQEESGSMTEARRMIEQAEARAMIPRIRKDSQGWSVVDVETGASLRVQTREDAVAIAYEGLSELERTSSAAMAQAAEEFMGLRPGAAEVVEISKQAGTMEREVKEGRVTEQQGQEAVELYGMMHGLKPGEARAEAVEVLGNNKAEEIEGIRTAVSRIWGGGNLITVMHEGIHGRWRAGLEKGHYTQNMGVQWVRMAERASGQQFLPVTDDAAVTPAMLDEAIVEVATADLIGKRKDAKQHFTPGLISRGVASFALSQRAEAKAAGRFATWLKAWKDFWGRVLRNAKALKKARAEGKLGEDFDSFLDDLLGAEPQQRFEAQAAREAVDMVGEVDNAPFSLASRAVPADTSKVVEMPDGAQLVGPTSFSIRAFHGTPHKVDKFSLDKIGTGEGAQAYGWGLYFAEEKQVAEGYQSRIAGAQWVDKMGRQRTAIEIGEAVYEQARKDGYSVKDADELRSYWSAYAQNGGMQNTQGIESIRAVVDGQGIKLKRSGNLYTVELLPDEDEFLDWDKPLSAQSQKVKAALLASGLWTQRNLDARTGNSLHTGEYIYEVHGAAAAPNEVGTNGKIASNALASIGIPGIKYLDGNSRDGGSGTSNYVIFDESLVKILEENGQKVQNEEEVEDEPGTLAPDGPVEDLPLEGEDIPWESGSFSIAPQHLPEVFVPFTKEMMDQILLETSTIAAIHIDRMKVGEFEGVPLQGGMFYPSIIENLKKGIVWAFNAANIARGVARQAALNGGYVKLVLMQEGNVVGNKTFGTIWFNLLEQSIAKKKISKTTALKELNRVRELYATHEKSAISTGHTKPWKTIEEARETIIGMPQQKRGSTYFQKSKTKTVAEGEKIAYQSLLSKKQTALGFPDPIDIVANIEEPSFKGVPTGAVVAIIKFDPLDENESVQTAEEAGVTEHLSYKYVLKGKPVARMMKHRVIDETFPDVAGKMLSQQYTNFPVEEAVGAFSLAPRSLASVADTVLASKMKKPEFREALYRVAREKMGKIRLDTDPLAERTTDRTEADWNREMKSREGFEYDRLLRENFGADTRVKQEGLPVVDRQAARSEARTFAEAWLKEEKAKIPTPKERQMAALRTLDAILSAFPAEIRGQVGGFVKLASLGSDKAREAEIVKRLEKLDLIVEKEAKKHYLEAIEGTFEKAKPKKGKAGEKPKGKLGANVQALVDLARTFSELDEMGVSAERAAIADRLGKATDPGAIADLVEREQLLDLFGAMDERTSAELEAAAEWLEDTYTKGRNRWRAVIEQRETETAAQRAAAVKEIGKQGLDSEQQTALKQAKTIKKASGGMALSWLSFEQVMSSILGRKSKLARDTVAAARVATNQKTDALRARRAAFKAAMSSIFGGVKQSQWQGKLYDLQQIGGVKVTKLEGARTETRQVAAEAVERIINGTATAKAFGLDALTLDKLSDAWADNAALPANRRKKNLAFDVPISGTPTETELSQLQAVHLSMMGRQAAYTEVLAGHGWTAEVMESIEKQLTPEAMAIRDWLSEQYRGGWEPLNEVYARMYGVNLPRIPNYAPGTFEARDMMGQDVDPYGQGLLSEGGFRAGMLKTRGKHNARPRLEDALSVYWGHVNATEHFQAFAEFARDLRGVMNNADVRASIKAKGGADLLQSGQSWIEAFERNGLAARSASSRWDEFLRRRQASQAYLALAYNMGTLMKQSTAALGSLLNMGPGQAARQFSKLVTNQLDLKAAYQSDAIQRRLDAGYSPEVRQAMAAMMAEKPSWGTGFVQKGMEIIGMVDAVFTTASYAMAYDFHLSQARAAGLNEAQAKVEAEREAEATVARTAQPSEMMDRSLFEMGLQPTGKFLFMFASEARQKAALALDPYAALWSEVKSIATLKGSSGELRGERATRLLLLHVVFPLAIQTITNLWRDAREDDDEELFDSDNWRAGDYAKSMVLGPALGIPLIGQALNAAFTPIFGGHYFTNDPTQPLNRALSGGDDILEAIQEGDLESGLKGMRSLLWAVALAMGGEKAAAVGVGSNILFDAFRVVENVTE